MGRLDGKVALITGAARGQGRSHALRLAQEGADIIAVDACSAFAALRYPMPDPGELECTAQSVRDAGRRVITRQIDIRDHRDLRDAVAEDVDRLGGLDIVVANAGVLGLHGDPPVEAWSDVIDVNLTGSINTIHAALPHLGQGASIVAIGSLSALIIEGHSTAPGADLGHSAYVLSKRLLAHYIHDLARQMAPQGIRVNVVHPTNCDTPMLQNDTMYRAFRPDLSAPTRDDAERVFNVLQAMPVPYVAARDVSDAVVFLASDESRYITGMQLRVDAGGYLKVHDYRT